MHVRQIESMLRERYGEHWAEDQNEAFNLSKSLAVYATERALGVSDDADDCHIEATDGTGDGGIDAIGVHVPSRRVVVTQAKLRRDGKGSVDLAGTLKFTRGVRALLDIDSEGPANWTPEGQASVRAAMDAVGGRIQLVVASTAEDELSDDVQRPLDDLLLTVNGTGAEDPLAAIRVMLQADLWDSIAESPVQAIDLRLQLLEWGRQEDPHSIYYGRVSALDLARLHQEHGDVLFAENIRMFLTESGINEGIRHTVSNSPELLLYYNNGITVLADSVSRALIGSGSREAGTFDLVSASVVNGAQTVTSLGLALAAGQKDQLAQAHVLVRCIELSEEDPDLGRRITRYANTQNVVATQDFSFLDPNQHQLRKELRSLGYEYLLRSGETSQLGDPDKVIQVRELAVALACASDKLTYPVLAKSEVSRLFMQDGGTYKALFNPTTSALVASRAVEVVREVDRALAPIRREGPGLRAGVAQHARLVIAHRVIDQLGRASLANIDYDFDEARKQIPSVVESIHKSLVDHFPDGYAGNLFKSQKRVAALLESVDEAA